MKGRVTSVVRVTQEQNKQGNTPVYTSTQNFQDNAINQSSSPGAYYAGVRGDDRRSARDLLEHDRLLAGRHRGRRLLYALYRPVVRFLFTDVWSWLLG